MATKTKKIASVVEGTLATDTDSKSIVLFVGATPDSIELEGKLWTWKSNFPSRSYIRHWSRAEWKELYDLKPPNKGKCFEVRIDLYDIKKG